MAQHTPGPWHRNIPPASRYPVIFQGRNRHVLLVAHPRSGMPEDEHEANFNLVVAAPCLLAAARGVLGAWEAGDLAEAVRVLAAAVSRAENGENAPR